MDAATLVSVSGLIPCSSACIHPRENAQMPMTDTM